MKVGEYLKDLRKDRGISQEELGKIVGVKRAAVQKWESGTVQNLKRSTIKKLADYFNVNPANFVVDSAPKTNVYQKIKEENKPLILVKYEALNHLGQQKTEAYVDDLLDNPRYRADNIRLVDDGSRPAPSRKIAAKGAKGTKGEPKQKPRKIT